MKHKIRIPVPKPFTRAPIPPMKKMRDRRKEGFRTSEKHKGKVLD